MNLTIAFYPAGYAGGISLLSNLIYALHYCFKDKVKCYVVCRGLRDNIPDKLNSISDGFIMVPQVRRISPPRIFNYISTRLFSCDLKEKIIFKKKGIDVIFGPTICYTYGKIPIISWIYDFQHKHLPEMFSKKECLHRDKLFTKTARISSSIIVTTESVKKDFENFIPTYARKVRTAAFYSNISESIYNTDPKYAVRLYSLPEKFFYLPNQFWKHKNHAIVFKAVKILNERGIKIFVVCSGYPNDYRDSNYVYNLFQQFTKWNIKEQVICLGMIPYERVFLLMRQSICVLNPSLFEGFGLTIDEARSLGKQVLLSDIPAHREQNPPKSTFFNPYDAEELAEKMDKIWHETSPGPDTELEEKARRILPERIKESAYSFMSIVKEVVK